MTSTAHRSPATSELVAFFPYAGDSDAGRPQHRLGYSPLREKPVVLRKQYLCILYMYFRAISGAENHCTFVAPEI